MIKLDITLILLASEFADVVARAGLGAHRAEDVVLVAGKHVLGIVGYDDVAALGVGRSVGLAHTKKASKGHRALANCLPFTKRLDFKGRRSVCDPTWL